MEALQRIPCGIWFLCPRAKHCVSSRWVFRTKEANNKLKHPKYKVQLVANGFSQKEGIDYNENTNSIPSPDVTVSNNPSQKFKMLGETTTINIMINTT